MQQARSGVNLWLKMSLFCSVKEDVRDLYTSAADTYLPSARPAITSVAAAVAGCCRICSTTVNRLISAAAVISYLKPNSRLLDDNSGPVVGSQSCSVAKIYGSNRIWQSIWIAVDRHASGYCNH